MLFGPFSLAFVAFLQVYDVSSQLNDIQKAHNSLIFPDSYGRYRTDCIQGEYLNLCAECVLGQTEKEEDFGTDSCGVCGGLGTCLNQCTDPMASLDDELDEEKGCTVFTSMTPDVLDLAVSSNGAITIFGDGINPENLDSIECSLKKDDITVADITADILEDKVELNFSLEVEEGTYNLFCNSSLGSDFKRNVQVVNTNNLLPMSVDKTTVLTWTENELRVTVSKMAGPAEMLCFGRDDEGTVVYKEWTSTVEGNRLSSTVVCPRVTIVKPGDIGIGIAYSEESIETAKTVKITGVAVSPNPVGAVFIADSGKVVVTFDQNIEETILDDCQSMFKPASLMIFGANPECTAVANEIHVKINDEKVLANTDLEFTDNVRTKFSEVAVEGSVRIDFGLIQGRNPLRLEGDERICPGDSTEVKVEGQQSGMPIWQLNVITRNFSNNNKIPPGQQQRLNLLLWAANRSSRAFPRALRINSSEVPPGMKYRISATAKDFKGADKQASMEVLIARQGEIWAQVHGPEMLDIRGAAVYEAVVKSCGVTVAPDKFVWEVTNTKGAKVDTTFRNGPRLFLDGGLVQPNDLYKVSVQAFQGEKLLGSGETHVRTTLRKLEMRLAETNLVVGTGQSVEVDASRAVDISPRMLKFKWSCKKGYCFLPGKDKVPLSKLETFSEPFLRLPPKSLAIGRYQLEVEAVMEYGKTKAELEVSVISGQPPYFSRLSASDLDPGRDFVIQIHVSQVIGLCEFYWESVPLVGVAYLEINESKTIINGSPNNPESMPLTLRIPKSSLRGGAKYRLRIVADCGRLSQSQYQFQLFIPDSFPALKLQVEPSNGNALETNFVYRFLTNETKDDYLFHFGFEEAGVEKYLYTGHQKEFKTIFGEGTYRTIVKVCRLKSDCKTVFGPEITTSVPQPGEISDDSLRGIVSFYQDHMTNVDLDGAKTFLELTVPTLKKVDEEKYLNVSAELQQILIDRIELYKERLSTEKQVLEASVQLLDSATSALTLLSNSDKAMTMVLKFRDLIHLTNQLISEKKMEKKLSARLPVEPRSNSDERTFSRFKRGVEPKLEEEITKQAVNAFLNLFSRMSNMTNDTKMLVQENIRLLDYIADYAAKFCNKIDKTSLTAAGEDLAMIGSAKIKPEKQKILFSLPQCSKEHCPNVTAQASVNLTNSTEDNKKTESFCSATGYLKNDILSDVSPHHEVKGERWGPIFWMDLLPYVNGLVDPGSNYTFLIPRSIANTSDTIQDRANTEAPVVTRGYVNLRMPLWNSQKPKGTVLKCSRYVNGTWNVTTCTKNKEQFLKTTKFLQCTCPYPGYYSVFAVPVNGTDIPPKSFVASSPPLATKQPVVLPTIPVTTPTISVPTTLTPTLAPATTEIKNVSSTTALPATTQPTVTNATSSNASNNLTTTTLPPTTASPAGNITENPSIANETTVESNNSSLFINSTNLQTTALPEPVEVMTPSGPLNQYKYLASFRINESFSHKVEHHENEFLQFVNKQLLCKLNLTLPSKVEPEKDMIKITMKIDDNNLKEQSHVIGHLAELLKNGTLALNGLDGNLMSIPSQDLQLVETNKNISTATTAFISVMVVFLLLLIGALISSAYLRNSRLQRCMRLPQGEQNDPPAPKYLRLHDTVSLGSSGPSTPNDMESSLAVVTRPQSRSYNTMDQFSNLPGNI